MKLVYPDLENQIVFSENIINVVTIENTLFFVKFIRELINQINGDDGLFVLSENNKEISVSKSLDIITDLFSLDVNSKKFINSIYSQLVENSIRENYYDKTNILKTLIFEYLEDLIYEIDIPLVYENESLELTSVFKSVKLKVEDETTSLLEKIIHYIGISKEISKIRCYIFINLKQFLIFNELEKLYQYCNYNKINLLLIESCFVEVKHENEKHYVIDKDLCEIF